MPTAAPTLTPAPTSPDRADRATFAARAVALDDWTKNNQVPEMQALGANVYANAVGAAADAATAAANAALTAADAVQTAADRVQTTADRIIVQSIAATAGVASVNGMTGAVTGIATQAGAETLTNKTLSAATNDVEARSLKSATTTVSVSAAAAPTAGQVLTATSSTTATWQAASGAALVYLSTVTASAASTADIETGFGSTYDDYLIIATNLTSSEAGTSLLCRLKIGGSYPTVNYSYHCDVSASTAATYSGTVGANVGQIQIGPTSNAVGSAGSYSSNLEMSVLDVNGAKIKSVFTRGHSGLASCKLDCNAANTFSTSELSGVRFYTGAGTISGTFKLYGMKKS